jgi:hypothetical protein
MDPPANDDFASCQTLAGAGGSVSGHNVGATREPGEPSHASTFGTHSVWYCWMAPRAGTAEWSTVNSDFDTSLAVYRGDTLSQLTPVASDNDSGSGGTSILRFSAVSNTVYRIAVDGRANAMGNITLSWEYLAGRLNIRREGDGSLTVTVTGANGTYTLEASSDLTNWSNLGSVTVTNGSGSVRQTKDASRRFYRVALPTS